MFSLIWSIIVLVFKLGVALLVAFHFWDEYKFRKFLEEEENKDDNPPKGPSDFPERS